MNKLIFNILLTTFCIIDIAQAQVFESKKLSELGALMQEESLPKHDSIFKCRHITENKSLTVSYNSKHEVKHLGISLFSPETKEIINLPVCNFIERIMLELSLQPSLTDIITKLVQYRIKLRKNGTDFNHGYFSSLKSTLDAIQNPVRFSLRKDTCYTAYWKYGNDESLTMSFPISRELIFGTDKKESDLLTRELFSDSSCYAIDEKKQDIQVSELKLLSNSDLYLRKGTKFLSNRINSDTFYQRSGNNYQLAFDPQYPAESLANLLIAKQGKSLGLKITHRMYGGFTPEFRIPLSRFLCLFDSGFTTYCFFNRLISDEIQVSAILYNNDFGYIHLLRIKTTSKQLFMETGTLNADLYTNIPQYNLKNLLKTY